MLIIFPFFISSIDITNDDIDKIHLYDSKYTVCCDENCTDYSDNLTILTKSALIKFYIRTETIANDLSITFNNGYGKVVVSMKVNLPYEEAQKITLKSEKGIIEISDDNDSEQRAYFKTVTESDSNVKYTRPRDSVKNFCYCLKSLYNTCKTSKVCYSYDVPIDNYYHSQSKNFPRIIANDPATTINIYLPDNQGSNDYKFSFSNSYVSLPTTKKINFISIGGITSTKVYFSTSISTNKYPVEIGFSGLSSLRMKDDSSKTTDLTAMNFQSIYLEDTPMTIGEKEKIIVDNLYSDAASLSNNEGKIEVKNLFYLNESTDFDGGNVYLKDNSVAVIEKVSIYPKITIDGTKIKFVSVDENKLSIIIDGSNCQIDIRDKSASKLYEEINEKSPKTPFTVSFTISTNLELLLDGESSGQVTYYVDSKYLAHKNISLAIGEKYDNCDNFHINQTVFNTILQSVETAKKFFASSERNISMTTINSSNEILDINFKKTGFEVDGLEISYDKIDDMTITSYSNLINIDSSSDCLIEKIKIDAQVNDSTVCFGTTIAKMKKDEVSGLIINHGDFDITFNTSADFVPFVNVKPDVSGLLYIASTNEIEVDSSINFSENNYRTGDDLIINVKENVVIPQSAILPKVATFDLNGNSITLNYSEKSRTKYVFNSGTVILDKSNKKETYYDLSELELNNTELLSKDNDNLRVDNISFDLSSFPKGSFKSVNITNTCNLIDNSISKIEFGNSSIKFNGKNYESPIFYSSNQAIFYTLTTSNNIILTASGTEIPENVVIELDIIDDASIHFDDTWNNVVIPKGFKIKTDAENIKIESDLLEFAFDYVYSTNGTKRTDFIIIGHKSIYTADLGFYILVGCVGFILIISISLFFCKNEEMDISSSSFYSNEPYDESYDDDSYGNIIENDESNTITKTKNKEIEKSESEKATPIENSDFNNETKEEEIDESKSKEKVAPVKKKGLKKKKIIKKKPKKETKEEEIDKSEAEEKVAPTKKKGLKKKKIIKKKPNKNINKDEEIDKSESKSEEATPDKKSEQKKEINEDEKIDESESEETSTTDQDK